MISINKINKYVAEFDVVDDFAGIGIDHGRRLIEKACSQYYTGVSCPLFIVRINASNKTLIRVFMKAGFFEMFDRPVANKGNVVVLGRIKT